MSTPARRRLIKDLRDLRHNSPQGVVAAPFTENLLKWKAVIFGPPGTPFEDGVFKLAIDFSEEYPNKAPTVTFVTSIFHPNDDFHE
eukprot:gene6021-7350_t